MDYYNRAHGYLSSVAFLTDVEDFKTSVSGWFVCCGGQRTNPLLPAWNANLKEEDLEKRTMERPQTTPFPKDVVNLIRQTEKKNEQEMYEQQKKKIVEYQEKRKKEKEEEKAKKKLAKEKAREERAARKKSSSLPEKSASVDAKPRDSASASHPTHSLEKVEENKKIPAKNKQEEKTKQGQEEEEEDEEISSSESESIPTDDLISSDSDSVSVSDLDPRSYLSNYYKDKAEQSAFEAQIEGRDQEVLKKNYPNVNTIITSGAVEPLGARVNHRDEKKLRAEAYEEIKKRCGKLEGILRKPRLHQKEESIISILGKSLPWHVRFFRFNESGKLLQYWKTKADADKKVAPLGTIEIESIVECEDVDENTFNLHTIKNNHIRFFELRGENYADKCRWYDNIRFSVAAMREAAIRPR